LYERYWLGGYIKKADANGRGERKRYLSGLVKEITYSATVSRKKIIPRISRGKQHVVLEK
jgi:hypothetical protein